MYILNIFSLIIVSVSVSAISPRDFVVSFAERHAPSYGVYTVIPISNGRALDLPFHFKRLETSLNSMHDCNVSLWKEISAVEKLVKHLNGAIRSKENMRWGYLTLCATWNVNYFGYESCDW